MSRRVLINGLPVDPAEAGSIIECEPGVYSILHAGASFEVRVSAAADRLEVDGHPVRCALEDPRQWKRSSALAGAGGRANITAPMPGKVVRILVATGDMVTAGRGIVVMEAMKMQNELKSPVDGVVARLAVSENEGVSAGALLAVIEAAVIEAAVPDAG